MTYPGGPRGVWDLYRFAGGDDAIHSGTETGLFPWWTNPHLKLAFFRPVPSLLRVAEEHLFGDHAIFCHAISIALFVVTTLAVFELFREWIGGGAASLGALLFAVDDAHATTVTWTAARHSLIGTLFVVLSLTAFVRARARSKVSIASGLLFFFGLASSESALSGLAFFIAFAVFEDPRTLGARARALLPVGAATVAWMGFYKSLGYGASGSAYYIDPLQSPARFASTAVLRAPILALAQLFGPPAEISGLTPAIAPLLAAFGAVFFVAFAWLSVRRLPNRGLVLALLSAFVLSLVPACGANSDDRLLMVPGIAAFGLLALWARRVAAPHPSLLLRVAAVTGALVHLVLAPLLVPVRGLTLATMLTGLVSRGSASFPDDPKIAQQTLVILSAPDSLLPTGMVVMRLLSGRPIPKVVRVLSSSAATPITVTRVGASVLELRAEGGMMRDPFVGALRDEMLHAGDVTVLPDLEIEVLAVASGGFPSRVRYSFREGNLDDGTRRFITWRDHRYTPLDVPPMGASIELPALDFGAEMSYRE